jgi:mannose-6-phosphate isomerase-like protein (cupin superfamily)
MASSFLRNRGKGSPKPRAGCCGVSCGYSSALSTTAVLAAGLLMIALTQMAGSSVGSTGKHRVRTLIRYPVDSKTAPPNGKDERSQLFHAMGYSRFAVLAPLLSVTDAGSEAGQMASVEQIIACIRDESEKNANLLHKDIAKGPTLHIISPCALSLATTNGLLDRVQEVIGPTFSLLEAQLATPSDFSTPRRGIDSGCSEDESVQVWIGLLTSPHAPLVLLPNSDVGESTTGVEEAIGVDLEAGNAVFIESSMLHEWTTQDESSDGSALLALKLLYAKPSCRYRMKDPDTGLPSNALPPVVLVRGKMKPDEQEQNNVMVVGSDENGNKRAQHRYALYNSRPKTMKTWQEADAAEKHTAIDELFIYVRRYGNTKPQLFQNTLIDNPTKTVQAKAIPHTNTKRLAYLASHWTHQMMYKPVHAPHRHLREEFIVLMSGEVRVTHLTVNGTIPRETIMSNVGDMMAIDRLAWHSITALNPEGAVYFCFDFISQADLQKRILPNRKDVNVLHEADAEQAKHGLVQYAPRDGNSGVHPFFTRREIRTYFVVVEPGMSDLPTGYADAQSERIIICLKGTLTVLHPNGVIQVNTFDHVLFYAGVHAQVENRGDTTVEYLAVDADGEAYDGLVVDKEGEPIFDPDTLSPEVREFLKKEKRNLRQTR